MEKFKNIIKNKYFLIGAVLAVIVGLYFFFKNKSSGTTSGTTVEEPTTSEFAGTGTGSGDYFSGGSGSNVTPEPITQVTTHDYADVGIENHEIKTDDSKQQAANKIYDLKELYNQTKSEFFTQNKAQTLTGDQQKILRNIHEEAQSISTANDFGYSKTGSYENLPEDTAKDYNTITGKGTSPETLLTSDVKAKRIKAQTKIDELKVQYTASKTQAEKNLIHQQAEEIGIKAGLGAGGTTGALRQTVNTKTGETKLPTTSSQGAVKK